MNNDLISRQDAIDALGDEHREELSQVTEALANNTLALQHLSDLIAWNSKEDDRK